MNASIAHVASFVAVVTTAAAHAPFAEAAPRASPGAPAAGRDDVPAEEPKVESIGVRGSSLRRVRATVAIHAPIERVRAVVFDFPRYPEFMPGYKKASVLRTGADGGRSVRLEIEQLGGMVRLWMRIEIAPPRIEGGAETYEARLAEGNVKAFQTRWELQPIGRDATRLVIESFVDPDLPLAPASLVNQGARDGVRDAILALRARAEGRRAGR